MPSKSGATGVGRRTGASKRSKSVAALKSSSPPSGVQLHLVVTRRSGDTERVSLGSAKTLPKAYQLRDRILKAMAEAA